MKKKKIAVILSGSGVYDGSEIHEATLSMYEIMKQGAEYEIFAPNIDQAHVINHLTGEVMNETRNVLIESARIARGAIKPLVDFRANQFDGLLLPGGFGAAKNLSSFAFDGENMTVNEALKQAVLDAVENDLCLGALCIAPVILAKILDEPTLTIGSDPGTIKAIESMGGEHEVTDHGEVIIDEKYKLVTTPCYMLDATIVQIGEGAAAVVKEMLALMNE